VWFPVVLANLSFWMPDESTGVADFGELRRTHRQAHSLYCAPYSSPAVLSAILLRKASEALRKYF
jgi:hypothetical protein